MPLKDSRGHPYCLMAVPGPDVLCTTVDRANQATGLPRQMERKVKVQKVLKCLPRDFTNNTLADSRENSIQQFTKSSSSDTSSSI